MNLGKELDNNQILLSIFPADYYNQSIYETIKVLNEKKVCYVTLNKSSDTLQKTFKSKKISDENIFYIDAVSEGLGNYKEKDNVIHVSSPAALTELSIAISESMKSGVFDVMLFDSLSTLKVYELEDKVTQRFTSSLISRIRDKDRKGIFICLEDDVESPIIKSSFMFVDKPVRFTELYNKIKKKKIAAAYAFFAIFAGFGGLSMLLPDQNLTGMVINEGATGGSWIIPVLVLGVIGAFFMFKSNKFKTVSDQKLLEITPVEKDQNIVTKKCINKVSNWRK